MPSNLTQMSAAEYDKILYGNMTPSMAAWSYMSRQGDFLIYCVETYKNAKHLTGKQVAELFTRYRVWDYVYSCFEALHTTGANYIVEDIDLYIEARKPGMA